MRLCSSHIFLKSTDNPRIFTAPQLYDILAAIEDLQTVSSRVYSQCDQFLASTFATAQASDNDSNILKNKSDDGKAGHSTAAAAAAMMRSRYTLRKTVSGLSGLANSAETENETGSSQSTTSQFSMIGSSLLGTRSKDERGLNGPSSVESSAELLLEKNEKTKMGNGRRRKDDANDVRADPVSRSWDWRRGWQRDATGEDVLRVLRLNIAKELARGWMDGEE